MKISFLIVCCFVSAIVFGQSPLGIEDIRDSINAQTTVFSSNIIPDRDVECSEEFGAILYTSNLISVNGGSSCSGSCHMPSNNFAPDKGLQGSQGVVFKDKGWEVCIYDPKDIAKDMPAINSPTVRGVKYRKAVLSKGQATKEEQPTVPFGGSAHQIDFNRINEVPMFQYYGEVCYNDTIMTEDHFVQAINDYQNSLEIYTPYTNWLRTGQSNRLIRQMVPKLWDMGCMDCHSGQGSVSENKGNVVLNSTGKNVTGSDTVTVRQWNYGDNRSHWFWNGSYVAYSRIGLRKHIYQETGEVLSDKEIDRINKFLKKATNEK